MLAPISRNVASSAVHISPLTAFLRSGRFRVTVTTPSDRSTSTVSEGMSRTILTAVGFNPYRRFRARPADYALVVAAGVVAAALVLWALLG